MKNVNCNDDHHVVSSVGENLDFYLGPWEAFLVGSGKQNFRKDNAGNGKLRIIHFLTV